MKNENKKNTPNNELLKTLNFFEEFCWLVNSNRDINFKNALKQVREFRQTLASPRDTCERQNEHNLIGILPSLLKDSDIFQGNAQLVDFANEVLSLQIANWKKKSRNEIIGLIICEVEDANKQRLKIIADWSERILNHKHTVKELQDDARSSGNIFSWNETIQKLVE